LPSALESISEVLIEHGPHAVTQGWQLVSWLASRLGWKVQAGKMQPNVEIVWRAVSKQGQVQIRIRRLAEGPPQIERVRVVCAVAGKPAAFNISVHDDRRLAILPEGTGASTRTMTIHPQPVPEMVGRQLSDREPDPAFQQSMAVAQIFAQSLMT
jgi:hypothetical protein